jgi:hypothetical protein
MLTFKQFLAEKDESSADHARAVAFVQSWAWNFLKEGDSRADAIKRIKKDSTNHPVVNRVFDSASPSNAELGTLIDYAAEQMGITLKK